MSDAWLAGMSDGRPVADVGGKGAGLQRLVEMGLPVPPFVVLTAHAYRAACKDGAPPEALPSETEAQLDRAWEILGAGSVPLAVRSSAVEEDSEDRSFAGQFDSFLNVRDRAALSGATLGCWRSLAGERAKAYRRARGAEGDPPAAAVVIQRMVAAEAAGVVFTVNAAEGRADEVVVSSVWGLGEGLVSGRLDADTFVLSRDGALCRERIVDKAEAATPDGAGGVVLRPVPSEKRAIPSLSRPQLEELTRRSVEAERRSGFPLDLEFAVEGGELRFLQARPVTAFRARPHPEEGNRRVWDNSNIVESYAGITSPLTFSFIRRAYHAVYCQFCEVLGLRAEEIRRRDPMLRNMLGLMQGRVYYNILNWYELVSLLPGFRFNSRFMESMMGVREPMDVGGRPMTARERYLVEGPRLLRTGLRAVWLQSTLERRIRRFHAEFEEAYARYGKVDYDALQPHAVLERYRAMETDVLWRWKAPIINDFSAMIFYGLLKRLTVDWGVDPDGSLQNALLSGQGSIESAEVAVHLREIAALIAANPALRDRFVAANPAQALEALQREPAIRSSFESYLDRFGDRSIAELKLESKPAREDPALVVAMLQSYVRLGKGALPHRGVQQASAREARAEAAARLGWKLTSFGLPKRWVYGWIASRARAAIRNRENQRLARARAYGVARRMFTSIGRSLARRGALRRADDVFYLELDEIAAYLDGAATLTHLSDAAEARKREYEKHRAAPPPPERFTTYGPASEAGFETPEPPASTEGLRGLGAFPGVVEGPAIVLLSPDSSVQLNGEILVARETDPGWILLFPAISGLIVERGSMLSHSAIVAREMGIPAVVGVQGATTRIRSGERVRLDGARGVVEVLERA